ncbi:MAG: ATP-binding protein, partial [Syntrophales bacterium]|nr:ATP-binding protein [Syntrophales bacterium]
LQNAEKLEAIGLLAGGIAHDFNNLLSGIFGYIDMARMQAEKGNGRGIENALSKACGVYDRAKYLTHQLLVFSKGGNPVRKTQSIVEHVQKAVSFALSGSNVSPVFAIPDEVWPCDFDENQIAQVFDNIVINARQAMPLGGNLDVAVRNISPGEAPEELSPHGYVCVSICDYGSGISKDHMPRIFDPFFTTKQQGSGLGLATSYSVVKKHDGIIHAESELGKGTTFSIYLPASSGQVPVMDRERRQLHRGHGRILIMDDEEFILDVASQMLTAMGYHVIAAINGDEAIAHVKSAMQSGQPFRAAILDLTIPGGRGGKETVHALLEIDPDIKVAASSGYSEDPVMSKPSDFGFAGRLVKPYRLNDLTLLLKSLLSQP